MWLNQAEFYIVEDTFRWSWYIFSPNITVEIHFGKKCLRTCCIFNCTTQTLSTLPYSFLKNFSKSLYYNKRKKASICLNFTVLLNGFWYFEQLCFSNCWKKKSFICSYLTNQIHDLIHIYKVKTYFFFYISSVQITFWLFWSVDLIKQILLILFMKEKITIYLWTFMSLTSKWELLSWAILEHPFL